MEAAVTFEDPTEIVKARDEWMAAAAEYASTTEGHQHFVAQRDAAEAAGEFDTAAMLNTVVTKGDALRAANRETAALIAAVRAGEDPAPVVPRTAEMAVRPESAVLAGPAPWAQKDRQEWEESVEELRALLPSLNTVGSNGKPKDLLEAFTGLTKTVDDPTSGDTDLAAAVKDYVDWDWKASIALPQFRYQSDGAALMLGDGVVEERRAVNDAWSRWRQRQYEVRRVPMRYALDHPNAGSRTIEALYERADASMKRTLTDRPDCPLATLNRAMREDGSHGPSFMGEAGWARARAERMTNPALALTLAAKDPNTWERNEAVNQLVMTPLDDLSEQDREWLAQNLSQIPNPANQKALASSLVAFAKGYADDVERNRLRGVLTSQSPHIREIGAQLETKVSLEREKPKKRAWLLG